MKATTATSPTTPHQAIERFRDRAPRFGDPDDIEARRLLALRDLAAGCLEHQEHSRITWDAYGIDSLNRHGLLIIIQSNISRGWVDSSELQEVLN